jgi:hypothetical protein
MTNGSLSALWDFYGEAFRLHSHQLLAWAHSDVRSRLHPDLDEPSITGLLAEAMKLRLDYHPDTPDAYLHYTIGDQPPHSPAGELGNDRLRLDITVIRSGIRPRLSFVFEAKRLRTGGFPISKYVGAGGMGDFISGRYADDSPQAAMVALVQNKDVGYWHSELQRAFAEDGKSSSSTLNTITDLQPVTILDSLPDELQSAHQRHNGVPLLLFHLFLDCRLLAS